MDAKDSKNTSPSFPEPFEFLNEELAPQFQRFQELESMRKAIERSVINPRDLKSTFPPPGMSTGGPSKNPGRNSLIIEAELKKLDAYLTKRIERVIKDFEIDADLSKQIREVLIEKKYPNPFENKSPKEIEWLRTNSKDIETSAQFLLNERRRFREKDQQKDAKIAEVRKPKVNLETANKNAEAAKSRFFNSLNYSKEKEASLEKVYDFEKNKDLILERE